MVLLKYKINKNLPYLYENRSIIYFKYHNMWKNYSHFQNYFIFEASNDLHKNMINSNIIMIE